MGFLKVGTAKLLNAFGRSPRMQGLMCIVLFCFVDSEEKTPEFDYIPSLTK